MIFTIKLSKMIHCFTQYTVSHSQKKKEINNFQNLLEILQASIQSYYGLENHQCKIRLRKTLTQSLFFPKFSITTCHKVLRKRNIYHEKCTQNTFSMLKAIA